MEGVRTFVYQTQEKGCGFAAVKMALIHISGDRRYAYVAEPSVSASPDIATLLSYAREYGLRLRALKTPVPHELLDAAEFPLILALRKDGPLHLAFVPSRRGKWFRVLDPARGPYWAKGEDLLASFTGIYMKIESYEEGSEPFPPHPGKVSHPLESALSALLALLPMALMSLGLALLDFSFSAWIVLATFIATIAASLVQRWSTLAAMRRFDKRYLSGIDAALLGQRKDLYVHYHAYKKAAIVSRGEVIGRFATVAAGFVVLLFHDVFLASACAIGLALLTIFHFAFSPVLREMGRQAMADEERYLHGSLDALQRRETLTAISSRAERYGRILGLKEGLVLLMGLGLASFACYCASSFALQPFLFAFITVSFFLFEGERIFEIEPVLAEKEREETYFRVHILPRVMEKRAER